jgi:hypothetical protein
MMVFVNYNKYFLLYVFMPIALLTFGCKSGAPEVSANIYLVAINNEKLEGKTFGCGNILVPITKNVISDPNNVEAALNELLRTKDTEELKNYVKGAGLIVFQVTIANGSADVYLKGDLTINDPCDIPCIQEQLTETAKQFPGIERVNFFINNQTLDAYLKIAKQGFK